ncbi:MAG: hypothetical protein ACM3NF_10055 [Gemmatimonadota bacterium]
MNGRRTWGACAAAGLALSVLYGCAGPRMTAANSINPVMFGAAKTMGTDAAARESSCGTGGTRFHHRESNFGMVVVAGTGGADFGASSTDAAAGDESGPEWSAILAGRGGENPARLDWKVFRLTGEDPTRRVELTSVRCGGISSFFLFGILIQNGCELEGVVPAAP